MGRSGHRVEAMSRVYALLVILVAALTLAACGGDDDTSGHGMDGHDMGGHSMGGHSMGGHSMGSHGMAGGSARDGEHNGQDVMFAQMMIPHHQQAITMAKQAAAKASSPEVKRLAADIEQAQGPEIQKMTGWLQDWGAPMRPAGGMHMGEGMMSEHDLERLGGLSGKAFDKAFLQMMIEHHQGAIAMAGTEQAQGSSADAKALASGIVTSQSAEITKMRNLLG